MNKVITETPSRFKDRFGLETLAISHVATAREGEYTVAGPCDSVAIIGAAQRLKKRDPRWNYRSVRQIDGGIAIVRIPAVVGRE